MNINADFTERVVLHGPQIDWQDSPMQGVRRRPLDRVGDEVARASTFVRYEPNSHFSSHVHTGGEEFIVLEGVFQDEHGDFPAGSYIRNPPGSSHTPRSEDGCVIFVKLWQFDLADRKHVVIDLNSAATVACSGRPGVQATALHRDEREEVRLEHWEAGSTVRLDTQGGAELLVLEGGFTEADDTLERLSWLRVPIDGPFEATVGNRGARVWVKTGHLRFADEEKQRVA